MKESPGGTKHSVSASPTTYDRIHFLIISLVHEKLYSLLVDPYRLLYAAGIRAGERVLEVGCGPGFFTIPAAKIVGDGGRVCALDINPVAVETVRRKVKKTRLNNVDVILADATDTKLSTSSFDVAFLFGVIHDLPDVSAVMREMHRVLTINGTLSVERSFHSKANLLDAITGDGLFAFEKKTNNIILFVKTEK
jgi:ubiquinone/menaquinone biosynthesis C-methylase UbiE